MLKSKITLYILLFILLVVALLAAGRLYLIHKINKSLDGFEALSYKSVEIDLYRGSIALDSIVYCPVQSEGLEFKIKKVRLSGFKLVSYLISNSYCFDRADIVNPEIFFLSDPKDTVRIRLNNENSALPEFNIDYFSMRDGYVHQEKINHFNLISEFSDIHVTSLRIGGGQEFSWQDLELTGKQFGYYPTKGLHYLTMREYTFVEGDSSASIEGLRLRCYHTKRNYYQHVKTKTSYLELDLESLDVTGFQLNSFIDSGEVIINKVVADSLYFLAHDDARIPECNNCYKKLPHEGLQEMSLPVSVNTFQVRNALVEYSVRGEENSNLGKITFNRADIKASGFTNIKRLKQARPQATLSAHCYFMNKTSLRANFTVPLDSKISQLYWSGHLASMDLDEFNKLFLATQRIRVVDGKLEQFDFNCQGNIHAFSGDMLFAYTDLKFDLLDEDNKKRKFLTGVFRFITGNKNMPKEDKDRRVEVELERNPHRSIFFQFAQTLQKGMEKSVLP